MITFKKTIMNIWLVFPFEKFTLSVVKLTKKKKTPSKDTSFRKFICSNIYWYSPSLTAEHCLLSIFFLASNNFQIIYVYTGV